MKRLTKCPRCNTKPRYWLIEARCDSCNEISDVYIDPNVLFNPRGYVRNVRAAVRAPESKKVKKDKVKKTKIVKNE